MKFIFFLLALLCFNFINAQKTDYIYNAKIVDVYDGDTVTALIDLGFNVFTTQKIRLYDVDTPEIRGPEKIKGIQVKNLVNSILSKSELIYDI